MGTVMDEGSVVSPEDRGPRNEKREPRSDQVIVVIISWLSSCGPTTSSGIKCSARLPRPESLFLVLAVYPSSRANIYLMLIGTHFTRLLADCLIVR